MRIIDLYIGRTLLVAVFAVLFAICGLDFLFSFIEELDAVGERYGVVQVLVYILLQVPTRMFEFTPVSVLIGCLVGLGFLASNSELVVLRATGLSVTRIVMIGVKAITWVLLFNLILLQWVIPKASFYAQGYRAMHVDKTNVLSVTKTNWQKDGAHFIHFERIKLDGTLLGMTRFVFDNDFQLASVWRAEQARFEDQDLGVGQWHLNDLRKTHFYPDHLSLEQFDHQIWDTKLTPETLLKLVFKPDHLSVTALWDYIHYLETLNQNVQHHKLVFWKKLLSPGVSIVMLILASSFLFGSLRGSTMGFRITVGIIFGLSFRYLQDFLGYSSLVYRVDPFWAAVVPLLVFLMVGLVNLRRVS